jgi:hypothetical protein
MDEARGFILVVYILVCIIRNVISSRPLNLPKTGTAEFLTLYHVD